ncbi:outer membrane protein assembly factor BamB family protein [Halocatena halophila]|uniref:outer membrane protein assembly factor BamB family protein n=1 Tax=Halocatena halophila TaxID=2814576 RepID=UPI002ED6831F
MKYSSEGLSRRKFLGVTAAGLVVGSGGVSAKTASSTQVSKMEPVDYSAQRDGAIGEVGPAGSLSEAWGGGVSAWRNGVEVGPIVGETVYAAGERLGAFDIEDGTEQWIFTGGPPPEPNPEADHPDVEPPTVVDGTVYAPIHYGVFDAFDHVQAALVALDAETGKKRWRVEFPVKAELSSVTVGDGLLYVVGGDIDGGEYTYLYCLQPEDGSVRWRQRIDREEHSTAGAPHVENGLVIATQPETVTAYDTRTGETVWSVSQRQTPIKDQESANGQLFITRARGIVSYDRTSGDELWSALPRVQELSIEAIADGTIYVHESTDPGITVIALDAETGEQRWKQAFSQNGYVTEMATDVDHLYVDIYRRGENGTIVALNRTDGSEQWRTTDVDRSHEEESTERVPRGILTRIGSLLYAGGAILDPATGTIKQTFTHDAGVMTTYRVEAITAGKLFLGGGGLIVVEGETTQQGTPQPTATEPAATPESTKMSSTARTTDAGPSTTAIPPAERTESTPAGDETTATNGPGFTIPAAIAALGIAGWRRRR